jgi:tetratricopeptide (TPR) repeat protein
MARVRSLRLVSVLIAVLLPAALSSARAQTPAPAAPASPAVDAPEEEMTRARIQTRIGLVEEALATYRALLERYPADRRLREEYAEVLVDAAPPGQAAPVVDRYLAEDPTSTRLRRLRARLDLAAGAAAEAGRRLDALAREQPQDAGLAADLAAAELAAGRWNRALDLYGRLLDGDPDNRDVLVAYREILLGHAPRIELTHYTLLQAAATHHVEEAAWRGWLADRWWLRGGARYGSYHQDRVVGQTAFTEEVWTAFATVGFQPTRALSLWAGIEEARRREDIYRTTGRLGAGYDDGRATTAVLDVAVRELLTNPVTALPRNGSTDRVTVDVARRVLVPVVLGAHYEEEVRADRYRRPLAVVIFRIHRFGAVAPERRAELGRVLSLVFSRTLRDVDIVCRYATEDAFAIILPETAPARAEVVVDRLSNEVRNFHFAPYTDDEQDLEFSVRVLAVREQPGVTS